MEEEKYNDYLAARVLTENKPVTYRLLSRTLKVNVNVAKWMLFDFHQKQNAKKPKSVHATFLVSGTKQSTEGTNGINGQDSEDTTMRSSPFMSSMPELEEHTEERVKKTTIVLVREEELKKIRAGFEKEASIHIYSLEPGPIEDLNVLSACNHEIAKGCAHEDSMERWRVYGSIHNPYIKEADAAKRRTAKYALPAGSSKLGTADRPVPKPAAKTDATAQAEGSEQPAPVRKGSIPENTSGRSTPQPPASTGALKRSDSRSGIKKDKTAGDIFKSFAKAKSKPKEAEKSQASTPAVVKDGEASREYYDQTELTFVEPMQGMSEDEGDADDEPEIKADEEKNEVARKAREERVERLRKMMEDDDEDMPDAPNETESEATAVGTPNAIEPTEGESSFTVQNGRRRGRRKIMKKKKVKDEDGYLVTKEEAVWESFSEDEPESKKLKPAVSKSANTAKGQTAGKKGQGSIASFFKKA
ncbi:Nn.00g114310.m01.CDS01 [Neocucurbitaria sp. VM-36]